MSTKQMYFDDGDDYLLDRAIIDFGQENGPFKKIGDENLNL